MEQQIETLVAADLTKREAKLVALLLAAGGALKRASLEEMSLATGLAKAAISQAIAHLASTGAVKIDRTSVRMEEVRLVPARLCSPGALKNVTELITSKGVEIDDNAVGYQNDNVIEEPVATGFPADYSMEKGSFQGVELVGGFPPEVSPLSFPSPLSPYNPLSPYPNLTPLPTPLPGDRFLEKSFSGLDSGMGACVIDYWEHFDRFWAAYPRKAGKKPAKLKWKTCEGDKHIDSILADIEHRLDIREWEPADRNRKQFIPLPATYLNQERWTDEDHLGGVIKSPSDDDTEWLDDMAPEGGWT